MKHAKTPREHFMCEPLHLSYDYKTKHGCLWVDLGHCTHMPGIIDYFKQIDPDVYSITVWNQTQEVVIYRKSRDSTWGVGIYRIPEE